MPFTEPSWLEPILQQIVFPLSRRSYLQFVDTLDLRGGERVLDFGSGPGFGAREIARRLNRGGRLACVDRSRRWQAVARRRLRHCRNVSFHAGALDELDLPGASFDIVTMHLVLHDIDEADRVDILARLRGLLKPGGRLHVTDPLDPKHGLSAEAMRQAAAASGFEEVSLAERKLPIMGRAIDGVFSASRGRGVA